MFEVNAMLGSFHGAHAPNPSAAYSYLPITVDLQKVVDLTDLTVRNHIETNVQELTGDWRGYRLRVPAQPSAASHTDVPTQKLGHELQKSGFEGFVTYSAKIPTHKTFIIFPKKLIKGKKNSFVRFVHPVTNAVI